jgi:hypothetical protein
LAISYNSQAGSGLLGVGWSLSGQSAISRCNKTFAQDGVDGAPQLDSGDKFCLNGNRLRATSGTYGADTTVYQTEIADFSKTISHGTAGVGPAWFEVKGKDGLTYEFGHTTDSAILASGSTSVRAWALSAVRDRSGNAMTLTYVNDTANGSYRLQGIQYTLTGYGTSNNNYAVQFIYQSRPSSDVLWSYSIGGKNNETNYLSQIVVQSYNGSSFAQVASTSLTYVSSPTTSRLRLVNIQECSTSSSDCLAATTVAYQDGQTGWGAELAQTGDATNFAYAMPIDVNGDGIEDIIYPDSASGHWYYKLGTTSGIYGAATDTTLASTNYASAVPIDFNGDGKMDVLVPNASGNWRVLEFVSAGGAFTYVDTTTSAADAGEGKVTAGDVDGDGRDDLIYTHSGGTGYGQPDSVYYRLNTGSGFSTTQSTLITFTNGAQCLNSCIKFGNTRAFGSAAYRFASKARVLDFNGDGRADLMVYLGTCSADAASKCGNAQFPITYTWTVLLSKADGTYMPLDAVAYALGGTPQAPPLFGDFNGDGCTDIAYVNGGWYLRFGTCFRAGATYTLDSPVSTGIGFTSYPVVAVDWDGDGRADLVAPDTTGSHNWQVARSTGGTGLLPVS